MTIHIYVWYPREDAWGHCAMWIEQPTRAASRYVSWWPRDPTDIAPFECNPASARHFYYDWTMEGRLPNREFVIVNAPTGSPRIDEPAMVRAWDRWMSFDCYSTFDRNCCTTVARLLRDAGGAAGIDPWEPVTWWGPNDIVEYIHRLGRRIMVREQAPRLTPGDGPRPTTHI